jgi:U1 small nuclear ribonucleoprotein
VEILQKLLQVYINRMSAIGLPAHILALFSPQAPLEVRISPPRARRYQITGLADFSNLLTSSGTHSIPMVKESPSHTELESGRIKQFSFRDQSLYTTRGSHTLFVARLSYETTERTLRSHLSEFGEILKVRIIYDNNGQSRGYGFIEYSDARAVKTALKNGTGMRIDGRNILLDIERSRTFPWLPRRLGGGFGPKRGSTEI